MSTPFKPGDVVVCVDGSPARRPEYAWVIALLKAGAYYRVSAVQWHKLDGLVLVLDGLPLNQHGWGFNHIRFRKIDDDIDPEFTAMLRKLGKKREHAA